MKLAWYVGYHAALLAVNLGSVRPAVYTSPWNGIKYTWTSRASKHIAWLKCYFGYGFSDASADYIHEKTERDLFVTQNLRLALR
jgi:hypothetical protein